MGLLRLFSFPLNLRFRSAKLLVESQFCICLLLYRFGHIRVRIPTPRGTVTVRQVSTNEGPIWSPSLVGETQNVRARSMIDTAAALTEKKNFNVYDSPINERFITRPGRSYL